MALYSYKGKGAGGEVSGTLEAGSEALAAEALMRRQIVPIKIAEAKKSKVKGAKGKTQSVSINLFTPKVTLDDLVMFARQMYALTKAGIPIMRAITGLAETTTSPRLRVALLDIVSELEKGRTLSSALSKHPKIFSRLFISLVNVGENTGQLEATFMQLALYYEREQETRKSISSAMRYPIFVLAAIMVAIVIMNMVVVPTFAGMFKKLGADLPTMTKILIASSNFFINYWWLLLAGLIGSIVGFTSYVATPNGKVNWDWAKMRIPAVGSIIERSTLSRYSRSFGLMLKSGVPITQGLGLVSEAVDNAYMAKKILEMRRGIERGDSLLRTSNASQLFTPLVLQMVAVGEETGQIDEMLTEVAEYYEREVDFDLKSLTAKIEPILISIVAGMVLVLALGIFTPMWDMMNAYK
ncbi:MSHA biogenesis protein MshG [Saccharobesus litoralis]|uniref:MSHA biogenesis protein MshG n=1 Tax=Saccharobesus litoralis TaxID=2172099 RepID=A0A2S0VXA7_9ALTE|nr:type II secretion system F family protein [Saccharobesus litoralis]AWB68815.1 MSHA biogenesis protein MshG [Saccharobesus litoralis]